MTTENTQSEAEFFSNFLRISGAYLFSCAHRDNLRAAYARRVAEAPLLAARQSRLPTVTEM